MEVSAGVAKKQAKHSFIVDLVIRLVKEKPLGIIGGVIVLMLLLVGILANFLAPYGMNDLSLADRLDSPSTQHIMGTDNLGRDLLSRIIYGARISMYVGLGGSILYTLIAITIGVLSGFIGGKFDLIVQRFVDGFMCFPPLVLYLTIMSLAGPGLVQVILVLGTVAGITGSRVIRSAVIGIKQNMYVEAARTLGSSPGRMLIRHILPNIMAPIIIMFTVHVGQFILAEATLSFLGFGIPPPTPSWGGMLSGAGRQFMYLAPWMALWPGTALAIAVYGINMLGDALRDLLDPRMRGGVGRYRTAKVKKARS